MTTQTATLVRGTSYRLRLGSGADATFKHFKKGEAVAVSADERTQLAEAYDGITAFDDDGKPYADKRAKFSFDPA